MKEAEMQMILHDDNSWQKGFTGQNSLKERIINDSKVSNTKAKKKKKILLIIIIFFTIVIISLAGIFLYFKFINNDDDNQNKNKEYKKEDLVVNINYKSNMIYRYILKKKTKMMVEGLINKENSLKEAAQFSDFFLFIKQENTEKDNKTLKMKKWFSGYLSILNVSLNYENNNTQIIENENLYNIINGKEAINNNDNISFVKVDFYENGDIKNFYIPKNNFSILNMQYIKEYSKLIFPKISSDLYTNSIENSLNELLLHKNI